MQTEPISLVQPNVLWSSSPWSIIVRKQDAEQHYAPLLPYARIGSHPGCEIQLDDPRLPAVAYLACVIDERIEVWPVAPISLPRWGTLPSDEGIWLGGQQVTFHCQTRGHGEPEDESSRSHSAALQPQPNHPDLAVVGAVRRLTLPLQRAVTIVGNEHPSVARIRGAGLQRCHAAVVSVNEGLWYLPLCPESHPHSVTTMLAHPMQPGTAVSVGEIQISYNAAAAPKRPLSKRPLSKQPVRVAVAAETTPLAVTASPHPLRQYAASGTGGAYTAKTDIEADGFTSGVTQRMVQIKRQRSIKSQLLMATAVGGCVVIAVIVLSQLWNTLQAS